MEGIIGRWKPGESSVRASGAGDDSRGKNLKGVNPTRDNSSPGSTPEEPPGAILPGMSQASSIRPLPAHKNSGHARPGKSREDPSESAIQPPAGAVHQQAVCSEEPYILFNGAEEYIVAQKIPGLVGPNGIYRDREGAAAQSLMTTGAGFNNFGPLARHQYTLVPKETIEESVSTKHGIAREIARGVSGIIVKPLKYPESNCSMLHRSNQLSKSSQWLHIPILLSTHT